jgi:putative SOS response-associated peptidase YedK
MPCHDHTYNLDMCGRYQLKVPWRVIYEAYAEFLGEKIANGVASAFTPKYNACPSQSMPILKVDGDTPKLELARWGLIPSWTKGQPTLAPINAKCETAATSGMFRQAMERRRCLVPVDGFFEWQGEKPNKRPHFIHLKDSSMFSFAGMWERWKPDPDAEPVDTFTIITTSPNDLMQQIHNRMPVILAKDDYARWLDRNNTAADVAGLLMPFPADRMEAWQVSTRVNTPKNNDSTLSDPIPSA